MSKLLPPLAEKNIPSPVPDVLIEYGQVWKTRDGNTATVDLNLNGNWPTGAKFYCRFDKNAGGYYYDHGRFYPGGAPSGYDLVELVTQPELESV